MKRPTIRDIAQAAQVSHATVSRALRNSSLVKSETTEIIRRIAEESGYRPSAAARSLVTRKTNLIGVVVTNIADPFVAEIVSGIEEMADEHAYSVYLANSNADSDRELRVVRGFEERSVDGIIVTSSRVGAVYVPLLSQMRVPIVLVNNQHPAEFTHSVMIANFQASREITRHLIQLGHKRIAYIGDKSGYQSDTDRFGGYRSALDESDLPFTPELVVHGDSKPESGRIATEHLLRLAQPPTAIFCYNDMTALGALKAIRTGGLCVPGDLSVAGFDDLFLAQYTEPPLTTIRQPRHEMGRLAMETLLKLMNGSTSEQNFQVPGELIIRQSTAPPKATEP
jgi:DNA-binding LacI/PurR family transcriptional regulator